MFGITAAAVVGAAASTPLAIAFAYLRLIVGLPTLTSLAIPVVAAVVAVVLIGTVLGLRGRRLVSIA